ncbi:hypothetical protein V2J56_09270 [Georgenia sp. MJ206]|uniref:hypothetical protein n=1 Tax=Georgenia wangjunii TaxID=3117730 RepID=UPI002F26D119
MTVETPAPGTPTQVAHPWRSVLRTLVAAAVGAVLAWVVRTLGVDLTEWSQGIVDWLTGAAWTVGTGLVQWLLTRPRLLPFWRAIGLGTGVEAEQEAAQAQRAEALDELRRLAAAEVDETPPPTGYVPRRRAQG